MCAKLSRSLLTLILLAASAGCGLSSNDQLPTPIPQDYLPTAIAMTASAANATFEAVLVGSPTVTATPAAAPTSVPVTLFPTAAPLPAPEIRPSAIQIQSPGEMSKIASPIQLKANVVPGADKRVLVELFGEDGRLLYQQLKQTYWDDQGWAYLSMKIPFEIRSVAGELGKLQISTQDKEGRLQALGSVHLILLSVGDSELNSLVSSVERCVLSQPLDGDTITGGILIVQGDFQPFNNQPVIVELLAEDGIDISLRQLDFTGTDLQPFTTTLPYTVSEPTRVRLVVRQNDDKFSGLRYLFSEEILLKP